jgi:hypothetical protein
MKDLHVISLAVIALVLHLGVFLLPLMGSAIRPPLAILTALMALVVILILGFATRSFDTPTTTLLIAEILAGAAAAYAFLSLNKPALWCLGVATTAHVLMLVVLLAFMLFFRMTRLW